MILGAFRVARFHAGHRQIAPGFGQGRVQFQGPLPEGNGLGVITFPGPLGRPLGESNGLILSAGAFFIERDNDVGFPHLDLERLAEEFKLTAGHAFNNGARRALRRDWLACKFKQVIDVEGNRFHHADYGEAAPWLPNKTGGIESSGAVASDTLNWRTTWTAT